MSEQSATPRVAILMCTYNGEKYLKEQLDSFSAQTYGNWELWVSDDGSTDRTLDILKEYQSQTDKNIYICDGPRQGFAQNFLSLLARVDTGPDYYSFSDQDDIWYADKIEGALDWLGTLSPTTPALYCSRTQLVDANGTPIGLSRNITKKPGFKNALLQCMTTGNTMVINRAARDLLTSAGKTDVRFHDWWVYLAITAVDGEIYFDPNPTMLYRQHTSNLIGYNNGFVSLTQRFRKLLKGDYQVWLDQNLEALNKLSTHIPKANLNLIGNLARARRASFFKRIYMISRLGLYRQNFIGTAAFYISVFFGKL